MGHLYFDSIDAFQAAFAPHAQSILAGIPNYTNTQPTIQVSDNAFGTTAAHSTCQWHQARDAKRSQFKRQFRRPWQAR
jgi:hypothetical protein